MVQKNTIKNLFIRHNPPVGDRRVGVLCEVFFDHFIGLGQSSSFMVVNRAKKAISRGIEPTQSEADGRRGQPLHH